MAKKKKAAKKVTPRKKRAAKKTPTEGQVAEDDRIPFTPEMLKTKTTRGSRPLTKEQKRKLEALKEQIEPTLREMVRSGHWMVATWWIAGIRIPMKRFTDGFPTKDFDNAVDTLDENLREEHARLNELEFEDDDDE